MKLEVKNIKFNEHKYVDSTTADIYVDRKLFSTIDFDGNSYHNSRHDDCPLSSKEYSDKLDVALRSSDFANIEQLVKLVHLTKGYIA